MDLIKQLKLQELNIKIPAVMYLCFRLSLYPFYGYETFFDSFEALLHCRFLLQFPARFRDDLKSPV